MSSLGVSSVYSREKNLRIIMDKYKKDPDLTLKQIRFLLRFTWIKHKRARHYPECDCLGCHALAAIKNKEIWKLEPHYPLLKGEVKFWRNKNNNGWIAINTVEENAPARDQGKYQLQINTPFTLKTRYFEKLKDAVIEANNWMCEPEQ